VKARCVRGNDGKVLRDLVGKLTDRKAGFAVDTQLEPRCP
jgi:hypothetical protein